MGILKKLTNWLRPDKPAVDLTLLEGPGGQRRLVDRETLAYLESDAPQPTQASLDALLVQAQSVRVFNDGCREDTLLGNDLLLEVSDPAEIQQLRSALQIMDGPGGHCMCYGGPTFEILSSKATRLALIGVHHGQSIRWNQWKDDARLADGRALLGWLASHGVTDPMQEFETAAKQQEQRQHAWNHWVEAMPDYLRGIPDDTWREVTSSHDLTPVLAAAREACPDTSERILALFEWYGSGVGTWTAYPTWEDFAERLLMTFSNDDLVSTAVSALGSDMQIEGAARFFAGMRFQTAQRHAGEPLSIWYSELNVFKPPRSGKPAALPAALKQRLWFHCRLSSDPDKRQRAKSAFR